MLKNLREILNRSLSRSDEQTAEERDHTLKLATATLLIEVMRADYHENLTENEAVFAQLKRFFGLDEDDALLLVKEAEREADHAVSLQGFTRLLHERLSVEEKHFVIEMLWRVALADEHLDKHEDHLVRKLADLLYVSHGDLIRIRNAVLDA
ncbi:MAG TPA: TerB family tellurite resistance protein [Gammaproteobacteria bacterium]|nr:TerB family tellurite resistance protein [Gammaproteobacteria bacterium]